MLRGLILGLMMLFFQQTGLAQAEKVLDGTIPPLEFMTGQMILVGFKGTTVKDSQGILKDIKERHLGGVVFFNREYNKGPEVVRNIINPRQVKALITAMQAVASEVLFVAADQEGGQVARLRPEAGFKAFPAAARLGKGKVQDTYKIGYEMGKQMADLGFNVNFAPSLDVNVNPRSPIIGKFERSFHENPEMVAEHGIAFAKGLNAAGIIATFKHFPGHGSSSTDSHLGLTDISETWTDAEFIPFKAAFKAGLEGMLMTGHLFNSKLDPDYPATLSSLILTKILRQKMGYQGVIVSDDMQMGAITSHYGLKDAVIKAVMAGVDILAFGNNIIYNPEMASRAQAILIDAVQAGDIPQSRIVESWQRIASLKAKLKPDVWSGVKQYGGKVANN